jgi:hypothetical protein
MLHSACAFDAQLDDKLAYLPCVSVMNSNCNNNNNNMHACVPVISYYRQLSATNSGGCLVARHDVPLIMHHRSVRASDDDDARADGSNER